MPGIVGNVDLNIAYKDYPSIINNKKSDTSSSYRNENSNHIINYVVKKGDTLSAIASKYNTTWQRLYEKNKNVIGKNPNKIYPGMVLKI